MKIGVFKKQLIKHLIWPFWLLDADKKIKWCQAFLNKSDQIIDIGSGMGSVTRLLRERGFTVNPVDVQATHVHEPEKAILYDGQKLPFKDKTFDVALLLTVLHHCDDPDQVLSEAGRVARRVIVVEDIVTNAWQRWLTLRVDSLLNWEFWGHPHTNRSDDDWRSCFAEQQFLLKFASKHPIARVFWQCCYVLDAVEVPSMPNQS